MSGRRIGLIISLLVALQLVALVGGLFFGPRYLVSDSDRVGLSPSEVAAAEDNARARIIAAVASLAVVSSVGVGIVQLSVASKKQVTDLVSTALAALGSESVHNRTAAIYSLSQLSSHGSVANWPVAVTLANLLTGSRSQNRRDHITPILNEHLSFEPGRPWILKAIEMARGRKPASTVGTAHKNVDVHEGDTEWLEIRRPDIHAAFRALGSMKISGLPAGSEFVILLHYVDVRHGLLEGLSFKGVSFAECDMTDSVLRRCSFQDCEFRSCLLPGCDLDRSRMKRCTFTDCDLSRSSMQNATLRKVQFLNCNLDSADMTDCRSRTGDIEFVGCSTDDLDLPTKLLSTTSKGVTL